MLIFGYGVVRRRKAVNGRAELAAIEADARPRLAGSRHRSWKLTHAPDWERQRCALCWPRLWKSHALAHAQTVNLGASPALVDGKPCGHARNSVVQITCPRTTARLWRLALELGLNCTYRGGIAERSLFYDTRRFWQAQSWTRACYFRCIRPVAGDFRLAGANRCSNAFMSTRLPRKRTPSASSRKRCSMPNSPRSEIRPPKPSTRCQGRPST
jgi:hypothetical protein